jgi:hypothetical protein
VKNFGYVEKTSGECNEDSYLAILYLSRVELHCKLQEKLHRVSWPLVFLKSLMVQQGGLLSTLHKNSAGSGAFSRKYCFSMFGLQFSKDVEVFRIVIHWFLKATGYFFFKL